MTPARDLLLFTLNIPPQLMQPSVFYHRLTILQYYFALVLFININLLLTYYFFMSSSIMPSYIMLILLALNINVHYRILILALNVSMQIAIYWLELVSYTKKSYLHKKKLFTWRKSWFSNFKAGFALIGARFLTLLYYKKDFLRLRVQLV